jgi:hypothetical protein
MLNYSIWLEVFIGFRKIRVSTVHKKREEWVKNLKMKNRSPLADLSQVGRHQTIFTGNDNRSESSDERFYLINIQNTNTHIVVYNIYNYF